MSSRRRPTEGHPKCRIVQEGVGRLQAEGGWRGGRSALWQFLGVSLAWLYVIGLHLNNDGLWFVGDAARHAANGLFWGDFLRSLPVPPVEFALAYYARYPVINPTIHPPGFYLLEGGIFWLFG